MKWLLLLIVLLILAFVVITAVAAYPRQHPFKAGGRTLEQYRAIEIENGTVFDQNFPFETVHFDISEGGRIAARVFGDDTAPNSILLVHGIGAAGERWNNPAGLLAESINAQVFVMDLRGHNQSSGTPYQLDRFGQYEDDIAEVISQIREKRPEGKFWLAGHSMGGGIALRFALKENRPQISGYILFAPIFGPGPTAVDETPSDATLRIDRVRLTALIILNMVGISHFNDRPVAYLNAPPDFASYSFTAIASGLPTSPTSAADALKVMEGRTLIISGADDPYVRNDGFEEMTTDMSNFHVEVLPGLGHDGILNAPQTQALIAQWANATD
ncbi:pimeloyl-ACP methyl ester carboxylesterase [Labrenzia sp. EL_208]|nr:pimeloyl-ACP methyl ester carboxylesterase [Labrenzia sp. EL_132]MBG6233238.1 pimeloyl-ACP methyl ester carboxylesterase [Labrenzia sp. EL_208]